MEDYDAIYKIVIVGDPGTGKSSLINRFVDNHYGEEYMATIGVDFKIKTVDLDSKRIKLQIWDTAGQERFKSIVNSYYRGVNGALIVFDLNNKDSFLNIDHWMAEIKSKSNAETKTEYILIGTKNDLEYMVGQDDINNVAKKYNMKYFSCSSKRGNGIDEIFSYIAETLYKNIGDSNRKLQPKAPAPALVQSLGLRERFNFCC